MNNKLRVTLHILGQILAQGAVVALVPASADKYFAALVAIVGVLIAFFDQGAPSTPNAPTNTPPTV